MFEKILANLPYNPKLISTMGFYAQRARKEESIRKLGLVFIILAFLVQFFAVLSPPKPSLADSTNDMIDGGFSSISELVADCKANIRGYSQVINYYGLSCSDLSFGRTVSLISTSDNNQLFSMGWNPQGNVNVATGKPTDEQPVNIPTINTPLYWRYLWSWDTYSHSTYSAVFVTSSLTGHGFYILYACGNLVSVGIPTPYTPPPAPTPTIVQPPVIVPAPTPTPIPVPTPVIPQTIVSTPTPKPTITTVTPVQPNCQYDQTILASSVSCKPCSSSLSSTDTVACIKYSKTAADTTQGWSDANGKTALSGDQIVYTLSAYNSGKGSVGGFVMQDDLSYVLDYADIISTDGGQIDSHSIISWPETSISAGQTLSHRIVINVKNSIPATLPSTSDPEYFDHIMTNVYGNTINIHLPVATTTTIATTASTSLPNTGPGSSLIIGALIALMAGYFFYRSRLLVIEAGIAIQDNNGGSI